MKRANRYTKKLTITDDPNYTKVSLLINKCFLQGVGQINGNYMVRRSSLDERGGSGGSVSSARSAQSVTR